MVPVDARINDPDHDAFTACGWQTILSGPDFFSPDQRRAGVGFDVMYFIGNQAFHTRQAADAVRLGFGQTQHHSVEQVFKSRLYCRGFASRPGN